MPDSSRVLESFDQFTTPYFVRLGQLGPVVSALLAVAAVMAIALPLGGPALWFEHLERAARKAQARGDLVRAESFLDRALRVARRFGPVFLRRGHITALALLQMAALRRTQKRPEEEIALAREALETATRGRSTFAMACASAYLGGLEVSRCSGEAAERHYLTAIRLWKETWSRPARGLVAAEHDLGVVRIQAERWGEAETVLRDALTRADLHLPGNDLLVALCAENLALALVSREHSRERETLLRRALAIKERALGQDHPDLARPLLILEILLRALDRGPEADELLARRVAIELRGETRSPQGEG